jgi:hypothetical protein
MSWIACRQSERSACAVAQHGIVYGGARSFHREVFIDARATFRLSLESGNTSGRHDEVRFDCLCARSVFLPLDPLLESERVAGRSPVSARPRHAACRQVIP